MICIVFIFITLVLLFLACSCSLLLLLLNYYLAFFQDLNQRQSSPNHLRTIQTPKTWHPQIRTAAVTPHSISAGGTGRGGCSFGDVGPGAAVGREEPHTEFSPGDAFEGVARAKFGEELLILRDDFFCRFFLGVDGDFP